MLNRLLYDVGQGPTIEHIGESAVHFRRSLSEEEIALLPLGWMAIPAVDGFSLDGLIEERL